VTLCAALRSLTLVLSGGILVLLVFSNQIVHVGLSLSELHLIHTLARVPVQEGLASEHGCELLADALEHLLDGCGVANEGSGHLQALWWDVANRRLDVVWNPLDKIAAVFALHVHHLLVNLLGRHAASEHAARCQVSAVSWVSGAHHVLGVEALRSELWHGECTVLLRASRGQRGETNHEEMQTRVWDQVDGNLTEIAVELTGESQGASDTAHAGAHKVVQVTVGWGGELEGAEADVVQGLVVQHEGLISVLNDLMYGQGGVVWLNDGIRHLGGWAASQGGRLQAHVAELYHRKCVTYQTEKVIMIRSGYSSRILEIKSVPMPEPVPPPREWVI
jgi:hypothetical protein